MPDTTSSRYTGVAIALHWAMAALILFMIWLGWNMDDNEARYQLHKSIGITILFLALTRLAWRFANPPPPLPAEMPALEKTASNFVHVAFYVLMIGIPLAGWLLVSISPLQVATVLYDTVSWPHLPFTEGLRSEALYGIVEFMHGKGAWVVLGLLALHVAGAVKHEFGSEDGVLKRMLPGLFGKPDAPALPARGALFAFGGSIALFAAIAALPLLASGAPKPTGETTGSEIISNWDIDYASSEIRFTGVYEGNAFSGVFESWTADVEFDPEALNEARVRVVIDTASARTGTKRYDDSLKAREWFNSTAAPQATVELSVFKEVAEGYEATATLTLKDKPVSVPLSFTLDIEGDTATLQGSTELSRKALDIGQSSDSTGSYIADAVTVTISGAATRKP